MKGGNFKWSRRFFWSGGGEGYKFILIVFSQRCLWAIQVAMSRWQFEMSFQIVKPGTVFLHPSKKGKWKQGWGMGENADLGDLIEDCYCLRELITRGSCWVWQSLESQRKTGYQSPQVTHASSCWDLAESLMPSPLSFPLSVFCSVRGSPLSCHFPLEQSNCEKNVCVLLSLQITSGKKKNVWKGETNPYHHVYCSVHTHSLESTAVMWVRLSPPAAQPPAPTSGEAPGALSLL